MRPTRYISPLLAAMTILIAGAASADVPVTNAADLFGANSWRSTPASSGVAGYDLYSSFRIDWDIQNIGGGLWRYKYTYSKADGSPLPREISHLLLEVSEGAVASDFNIVAGVLDAGPQAFHPGGAGNSNPGLPASVFAIKLNPPSPASNPTVEFTTYRPPVWGDFYAKDGVNTIYAYNTGFGTEPTLSTTDLTPWVPRPDTGIIPEPAFFQMGALAALGGLGLVRKRRYA